MREAMVQKLARGSRASCALVRLIRPETRCDRVRSTIAAKPELKRLWIANAVSL
jgi:hypothetical protein